MTGIREKAHKKRLAATRTAAKDAALTAALPGVLQASEQQEEADLIEITRARYRGFVEIESDDEESEERARRTGLATQLSPMTPWLRLLLLRPSSPISAISAPRATSPAACPANSVSVAC